MSKILVVDDEPYIRRCLSFVLTQQGHEVETVDDGDAAWRTLEAWRPDAVFLDLMLPRRSGYDLCQAIRQNPNLAGVVIIMLTAKGQEIDRVRGLELGADEYCTKPFSPRELTLLLENLLERAQATGKAN
jgi:DNA-binding response OmpR family regulator